MLGRCVFAATRALQEIRSDRQSDSCLRGINAEPSSFSDDREKTNYTVHYVCYIIVTMHWRGRAWICMRRTRPTAKDIMGIKVKGIPTRVAAPGRRKVKFIVYIFSFSFPLFFPSPFVT